jgi:hypothetical protein
MGKMRTLFAAMMLLVVTGVAQAATLVDTDFSKGDTKGWVLNALLKGKATGPLQVVDVSGDAAHPKALQLTSDKNDQTGVAWTEMKFTVPTFSFIADASITHAGTSCPADGVAMSFANVDDPTTAGGGGGSLGLFGGSKPFAFAALEVNEWREQGLGTKAEQGACTSGKNETFAFDVINDKVAKKTRDPFVAPADPAKGGARIGQVLPPTGMKIVNGGFFRYQWNVAADGTMTAFVSGLDKGKNDQFQKVKVLEVKIDPSLGAINFAGRFGLSAATGGADIGAMVAHARIDSPMIEPQ